MKNTCASILWNDKGLPHSVQFDDKYFCEDNGFQESLYTFCGGNDLPQRFAALTAGQTFTIGETGFGTGLNFVSAWQLFQKHAPSDAILHYISLDKFPLSSADLKKAMGLWPELNREAVQLCEHYAVLGTDGGEITFDGGRVKLLLFFDDVLSALDAMARAGFKMDAWFLDGFGPAKNPEMWSPEVFNRAAQLSKPGTTCATFTVAGHVRRALAAAGFSVEKSPGFGRKLQMLKGAYGPDQNF